MIALLLSLAVQDMWAKPGKEHEILKSLEGEWESVNTMTPPGGQPVKSKGKESCRLIAGGLFLLIDTQGEMFGGTFIGHGTMGYDVHKKKYTGAWIDNMATGVYLVEGTLDEKGTKLTEWMEGVNPQNGEKFKMKLVHEIKDKDHRSLKFFMGFPDGTELETGSIEYTRKK